MTLIVQWKPPSFEGGYINVLMEEKENTKYLQDCGCIMDRIWDFCGTAPIFPGGNAQNTSYITSGNFCMTWCLYLSVKNRYAQTVLKDSPSVPVPLKTLLQHAVSLEDSELKQHNHNSSFSREEGITGLFKKKKT